MLIKLTSKMNSRTKRVNILVAGMAALAFGATASASAANYEKVTTTIDSRDLVTDYGVSKVYSQLQRKADLACGASQAVSLNDRSSAEACASSLLDDFVANVKSAELKTLHEQTQRQIRRT